MISLTQTEPQVRETKQQAVDSCPGCDKSDPFIFYEVNDVPVQSMLLIPTREEALAFPSGDIALAFCRGCGLVYNRLFEPDKLSYSKEYEATQGFSGTFNTFARHLANKLIERYDLHEKIITEIGCGAGEFLIHLCETGNNQGVGFDPAYSSDRLRSDDVIFIDDFYSEKYIGHKTDFICCKMTLEHIPNTEEFISMIKRSISGDSDPTVFFQVPNASHIFEGGAFWDIYYEHCCYFTELSLKNIFTRCDFNVLETWTDFNDQYLMLTARPNNTEFFSTLTHEENISALHSAVTHFSEKYWQQRSKWLYRINNTLQNGGRVVLWGSGSKAVAFLSTLNFRDEIEYIVDINPYRQNTFSAGTGQEIVAPDFLKTYRPDLVVVMNPNYQAEISQHLNSMDLKPQVMSL